MNASYPLPASGWRGLRAVLADHWPEYLIEGAALGLFMISAGLFATLFEYPGSPVHQAIPDPTICRILIGVAMGVTAIGIIYSPWGQRSGAHMNPATTLTFWTLGKVKAHDALANIAAGVVVAKFGAASVSVAELELALSTRDKAHRGVVDLDKLLEERAQARRRGEIVVMTNGCFDLLHEGHIRYLREAKALGTRLVVAVNDDDSVTALKGPSRPLNCLASRMAVLAALDVVDWVVPFGGATPRDLVAAVLPDVLVKGGDYEVDTIVGAAEVLAAGGRVTTVAFHGGFSTTALVERIAATGQTAP